MDLATLVGIVVCFVLVVFGIVTGDAGFAALGNFIHAQSALITFGGAFFSVMVFFSMSDYLKSLKAFRIAIKAPKNNEGETIGKIIELSNIARKEGLLALEEAANNLEDEFMKKGILLIVDGTDPELVRSIMENEMVWGMVGTLIGLINMLRSLSDISTVGPNMSTALITTLYGSLLANWIATPVAGKLKYDNTLEIMMKEVMIEGLLSIQAGENPRVIEEKLKSFLAPEQRATLGGENQDDVGGA